MSELENILDDALAEFDKDQEEVKSSTQPNDTNKTTSDPPLPDFNEFVKVTPEDEDKYIDDLTKEFDKAFSNLLDSTPKLRTTLSDQDEEQGSSDMEANIAQTMEKLFRDAAAAGAHPEDSSEKPDVEGMVPVLENLLSKLLSKEILHEPLQELLNLYPDWLEKNKDHPKFAVYSKQCQIVQEICDIFNGNNSQDEGSRVYSLLNAMQETGPPPDEIVKMMSQEMPDAMRGGPVPGAGLPGEQCCIQ
ncbi:hypothetical protein ACHWQZ_G018141 [Mnemiopsis leidyi]